MLNSIAPNPLKGPNWHKTSTAWMNKLLKGKDTVFKNMITLNIVESSKEDGLIICRDISPAWTCESFTYMCLEAGHAVSSPRQFLADFSKPLHPTRDYLPFPKTSLVLPEPIPDHDPALEDDRMPYSVYEIIGCASPLEVKWNPVSIPCWGFNVEPSRKSVNQTFLDPRIDGN
jgi:hypothetical protein